MKLAGAFRMYSRLCGDREDAESTRRETSQYRRSSGHVLQAPPLLQHLCTASGDLRWRLLALKHDGCSLMPRDAYIKLHLASMEPLRQNYELWLRTMKLSRARAMLSEIRTPQKPSEGYHAINQAARRQNRPSGHPAQSKAKQSKAIIPYTTSPVPHLSHEQACREIFLFLLQKQ